METVVIGAGLAGASVAYSLRLRGRAVRLIDPLCYEGSATPAAAGMLAPLYEAEPSGPLLSLGLEATQRYPEFLRALERSSGESIPFKTCQMLVQNRTPEEHEQARTAVASYGALGCEAELLAPEDAARIEPAVGRAASYLRLADQAFVDVRALSGALPSALHTAGAELLRLAATGVISRGGTVRGVWLSDGVSLDAHAVVIAGGAWSGELEGLPRPVPVRPVRGQMMLLGFPDTLSCLLADHGGRYLVPFGAQRVLAGSTMEEVGFDASVSEQGKRAVRAGVERLVPGLAASRITERWAGLRPVSADGLPLVGPDPDLEGLWYATGYGRGGILLAPLLGELLAAEMAGEPASHDFSTEMAALRPARFVDAR
jgi:glycine oxidase